MDREPSRSCSFSQLFDDAGALDLIRRRSRRVGIRRDRSERDCRHVRAGGQSRCEAAKNEARIGSDAARGCASGFEHLALCFLDIRQSALCRSHALFHARYAVEDCCDLRVRRWVSAASERLHEVSTCAVFLAVHREKAKDVDEESEIKLVGLGGVGEAGTDEVFADRLGTQAGRPMRDYTLKGGKKLQPSVIFSAKDEPLERLPWVIPKAGRLW